MVEFEKLGDEAGFLLFPDIRRNVVQPVDHDGSFQFGISCDKSEDEFQRKKIEGCQVFVEQRRCQLPQSPENVRSHQSGVGGVGQ